MFGIQKGCNNESLNELMQRHEGLVHLVIQRQALLTLPYEEGLQAGCWGLWRAILGYDPGRRHLCNLCLQSNYEVGLGGCTGRTAPKTARSASRSNTV
jgi:hypothetical protein